MLDAIQHFHIGLALIAAPTLCRLSRGRDPDRAVQERRYHSATYPRETLNQPNLQNRELESYGLKKTLSVVLDQLPQSMQLIQTLKYFEDLNFFEISKVVNLSEGRIKDRDNVDNLPA